MTFDKRENKDWMLTSTRRKVYPLDFKVEDVDIEDIATSLAKQCRYNGHCDGFYSVAEHSHIISRALENDHYPREIQRLGLLHDASETYTGDIIRPLKNALRGQGFDLKPYELAIEETMSKALGLPWPWPEVIHEYDKRIVRDEKDTLKSTHDGDWMEDFGIPKIGLGIPIKGWEWKEAREKWLKRYHSLTR
jgi:hypothetical protein